jgi:hypothetical protein
MASSKPEDFAADLAALRDDVAKLSARGISLANGGAASKWAMTPIASPCRAACGFALAD